MLVEIMASITTKKGVLYPGQRVDIPVAILPQLAGKVRPVSDDLHQLISDAMTEIDKSGRPWTGWYGNLTDDQRKRLKSAEREVDRCCLAGDRAGLVEALARYKRQVDSYGPC